MAKYIILDPRVEEKESGNIVLEGGTEENYMALMELMEPRLKTRLIHHQFVMKKAAEPYIRSSEVCSLITNDRFLLNTTGAFNKEATQLINYGKDGDTFNVFGPVFLFDQDVWT